MIPTMENFEVCKRFYEELTAIQVNYVSNKFLFKKLQSWWTTKLTFIFTNLCAFGPQSQSGLFFFFAFYVLNVGARYTRRRARLGGHRGARKISSLRVARPPGLLAGRLALTFYWKTTLLWSPFSNINVCGFIFQYGRTPSPWAEIVD